MALFWRDKRLRFSITSLVVLTALACASLACVRWSAERQRRAVEIVEAAGGHAHYDHWLAEGVAPRDYVATVKRVQLHGAMLRDRELSALANLSSVAFLDLSGCSIDENAFVKVGIPKSVRSLRLDRSSISDTSLRAIRGVPLESLSLEGTAITDAGIAHAGGMNQLKHLNLAITRVTGRCLESLRELANLEDLNLQHTNLEDADVSVLQTLGLLRAVWLGGSRIPQSEVLTFRGITSIEFMELGQLSITEGALEELREALPKVRLWTGPVLHF